MASSGREFSYGLCAGMSIISLVAIAAMRSDGSEAATIFCFGGPMAAGETLPLGCDSNRNDWPAKYDRIELETD